MSGKGQAAYPHFGAFVYMGNKPPEGFAAYMLAIENKKNKREEERKMNASKPCVCSFTNERNCKVCTKCRKEVPYEFGDRPTVIYSRCVMCGLEAEEVNYKGVCIESDGMYKCDRCTCKFCSSYCLDKHEVGVKSFCHYN
jgi:hypothetical protein